MKFYRDDATRRTTVQWYFVPWSNGVLPYQTAFGTNLWERWEVTSQPLGEQLSPHPYRNGLNPDGLSVGGLCGTEDQWFNGAKTTDPIPPLQPGSNSPVCCSPVPILSTGGSRDGKHWDTLCGFDSNPFPAWVYAFFHVINDEQVCTELNDMTIPMSFGGTGFNPPNQFIVLYSSAPFNLRGQTVRLGLFCENPQNQINPIFGVWTVPGNSQIAKSDSGLIESTTPVDLLFTQVRFIYTIFPCHGFSFYNVRVTA